MEAYFIRRTRGHEVQHLMDLFKIDRVGVWKNPMDLEGISLPLVFSSEFSAEVRMHEEQKKDSSWNYEICEFLR